MKSQRISEPDAPLQEQVLQLLSARTGHFLLESGHHGELWLDLELLFQKPRLIAPFAAELAGRLSNLTIEAVCGPFVEGAFVAMMSRLNLTCRFLMPNGLPGSKEVSYSLPITGFFLHFVPNCTASAWPW